MFFLFILEIIYVFSFYYLKLKVIGGVRVNFYELFFLEEVKLVDIF